MNPNISFGSLTAGNRLNNNYNIDFKDLKVEDLDIDKDGIVSDEELNIAIQSGSVDVLELSSMDADADQKVTEEQYVLWQQTEEMDNLVEIFKDQAAKDLAGAAPEDLKNFADKLVEFENNFKAEYLSDELNDISKMAKAFSEAMPAKFKEIKADVQANTKSAVKARVINNVIKEFLKDDSLNGYSFTHKVNKSSTSLSANAQRLLNKTLTTEADRFIKGYTGDNFEKDLTAYLTKYLKTSDRDKLAEAIGIWDKEIEEPEETPAQEVLHKFKKKATQLLLTALENKIFLKIGDFTVRTEANIMPALAQFKDAESLRWAVNKAINELSRKTRIQEMIEADQMETENDIQNNNIAEQFESQKIKEEEINFFQ